MSYSTDSADTSTDRLGQRLTRLAVAVGVIAASLTIGSAASAKSPAPGDDTLPPITADKTITVNDNIRGSIPKMPRFDPVPLPCFGWWCILPPLQPQLPDYEVTSDYVPASNSYFEGQKAVPYYVTIRNIGHADPGEVWSTLASPDGQILAVQPVNSWRTDITAQPLSATARWDAPNAIGYLNDGWVVQDSNGIPTGYGYNDIVYLRVWMAGWDRPELIVSANDHAGVDFLGAQTPLAYEPHTEVTRDNNRRSFWT